jgi:hypothetical protein
MDQEDRTRYATQRAAEIAAPLTVEIADRLGLDLRADDNLALRILTDFAVRLYEGGYTVGATDTTAQFIEQLPPGITVNVSPPVEQPRSGPLGDTPGWDGLDSLLG